MEKKKVARLAGFVGALCASGALVGISVSGTGAYFTDSHDGSINSSTGHVAVNLSNPNLNYANLLPGEYQTQNIDYQANGTGAEDIWLVIPTNGDAAALGQPDNPNALGRYGHLKVSSTAGSFESNNLSGGTDQCPVDGNGHGGSNVVATYPYQGAPKPTVPITLPYCAAPTAILLDSNLPAGATGTASVEFGFTSALRSGQDSTFATLAKFKIVATQHGIRPDDVSNPAN